MILSNSSIDTHSLALKISQILNVTKFIISIYFPD